MNDMETLKINMNDSIVKEALYAKFKKIFEAEIKEAILNQKPYSLGDIGIIQSRTMYQGTKSSKIIKNVRVQVKLEKPFRKQINKEILGKF